MERGVRQKGRRERQSNRLIERERERKRVSIELKWF
jgi:hypothetical protein